MSDFADLIRAHLDPRAMAADAFPEVVYVGGPDDGRRSYTFSPLPHEMHVPVGRGITVRPGSYHRYALVYVDGVPSLDDVGAYRFEYVETTVDLSR